MSAPAMRGQQTIAWAVRGWTRWRSSTASRWGVSLAGVFPPIATPFATDETLDLDGLARNVRRWNALPFRGYLVLGTNGEQALLSDEEKVAAVKAVRAALPADRLLLAGSGCDGTGATVRLTRALAEAGADVAVVVTPSRFKNRLTTRALLDHYASVADASPVPVVLYNVPASTGLDLPLDVVLDAARHPNVVGLKDSSGDVSKLAAIVRGTEGTGFQVLAGSASYVLPAYLVGCVGAVCALANVLGEDVCRLHRLVVERRLDEAAALQRRLVAPNRAVTSQFGVSGLKAALQLRGYVGGKPRRPLAPLDDAEVATLRAIFAADGFPLS